MILLELGQALVDIERIELVDSFPSFTVERAPGGDFRTECDTCGLVQWFDALEAVAWITTTHSAAECARWRQHAA